MMAGDYVRRSVAEFVGTFALIFIGAGSVIYGDIVGVALAHGLTIAVMVSAVGLISGGFFNPAITIAFLVTRRIAPRLAGLYLLVQLVDNHWGHFWVWYVGPIAGGAIAALVYEALYLGPPKPEPVGPPETGVEETAPGTAALE